MYQSREGNFDHDLWVHLERTTSRWGFNSWQPIYSPPPCTAGRDRDTATVTRVSHRGYGSASGTFEIGSTICPWGKYRISLGYNTGKLPRSITIERVIPHTLNSALVRELAHLGCLAVAVDKPNLIHIIRNTGGP